MGQHSSKHQLLFVVAILYTERIDHWATGRGRLCSPCKTQPEIREPIGDLI